MRRVVRLYDYRGYGLVLYLAILEPKYIVHIGYLDDSFFGYKIKRPSSTEQSPQTAIDHYLDTFYFKSPELDYSIFSNDNKYKLEMASINFIRMTLHTCKSAIEKNALIWKVGLNWRFLDNDRNVKHESSNGDIITKCPFCRKYLK